MILCFLLFLWLFKVHSFEYYIEMAWKAGYRKNQAFEKAYKVAKLNYIKNPKSIVSCDKDLYTSPLLDPDFVHFFRNFVNRGIIYNEININLPRLEVYDNPVSYFVAHTVNIENQLISISDRFRDYVEIVLMLKAHLCLLQEVTDALAIILQHCDRIDCFQATCFVALVEKLAEHIYQYITKFKFTHMATTNKDKGGILDVEQVPQLFYLSGKKYEMTKVLLLKKGMNFGTHMSRFTMLSSNFLDHIWILHHRVVEKGNHAAPLRIILQNYFKEKIKSFKKIIQIDNSLVCRNVSHMNILLTNLFGSTFFGVPVYLYKFESVSVGDNLIIKILDLSIRKYQILTLASSIYNFTNFSADIDILMEELQRLYKAIGKYQLVLRPFKEFYTDNLKRRIVKIGKLWNSGEVARIKLVNVVGSNRDSEHLFDSLDEWLEWVRCCFASENTPQDEIMLKAFKDGF